MDPKTMTIEQVEARLTEIRTQLDGDADCDITALTAEVDALQARRAELKNAETARKELRSRVAAGTVGDTPQPVVPPAPEARTYTLDSPEYRSAWLKHMSGRELTDTEQRALTTGITGTTSGTGTDTTNQALYVPTEIQNRIWDQVSINHAIAADVTTLRSGTVIDIPIMTAMSDASLVAENAQPTETTFTLAKVTLAGKDHAAWIELSYATQRMALPALESFLVQQIANRMGDLIAKDIVDTVTKTITADTYAKAGIKYTDFTAAFGKLKRVNNVTIYLTRATLYNQIAALTDTTGKPLFQLDPTGQVVGHVLGAGIKIEDAIADGSLIIGDASKITRNVVQDIMIETDRDIKKHMTTYSAYEREESVVVDAAALVVLEQKTTT
ncbi:MAG: phage major capsid protein [Oscillospiraceae bacterium]|nr:phage major capsid protein [Oscillospiraceae bacterium]